MRIHINVILFQAGAFGHERAVHEPFMKSTTRLVLAPERLLAHLALVVSTRSIRIIPVTRITRIVRIVRT